MLFATGQFVPVFSKMILSFSLALPGRVTATSIFETRRGSLLMCFVTSAFELLMSTFISAAFIPIVVSMQVASETHNRSVGENRSPFPRLSVGASVSRVVLLCKCSASQRKFPLYIIDAVILLFLYKFTALI